MYVDSWRGRRAIHYSTIHYCISLSETRDSPLPVDSGGLSVVTGRVQTVIYMVLAAVCENMTCVETEQLERVEAPSGVEITMETDVIARCPVGDGIDRYQVEVRILSDGQSVECNALQEFLDGFIDVEASQETVTAEIADALTATLPDARVHVETAGEHAGVQTEVVGR